MKVETLVQELLRKKQAGEQLPEFEQCVRSDGRTDYTLMMARLLVNPERIKEFNIKYDGKILSYVVPNQEMDKDLHQRKISAWAIIVCGLAPNMVNGVCKRVGGSPEQEEFLRKNYGRFIEHLKPVLQQAAPRS